AQRHPPRWPHSLPHTADPVTAAPTATATTVPTGRARQVLIGCEASADSVPCRAAPPPRRPTPPRTRGTGAIGAASVAAPGTTVPDLVSVDVGSHAQSLLLRRVADKQPKTSRNVDRLTLHAAS